MIDTATPVFLRCCSFKGHSNSFRSLEMTGLARCHVYFLFVLRTEIQQSRRVCITRPITGVSYAPRTPIWAPLRWSDQWLTDHCVYETRKLDRWGIRRLNSFMKSFVVLTQITATDKHLTCNASSGKKSAMNTEPQKFHLLLLDRRWVMLLSWTQHWFAVTSATTSA